MLSPRTVPRWNIVTSKNRDFSSLFVLVSALDTTRANKVWSSPDCAVQLIKIGFDDEAADILPKPIEVTTTSAEEGEA